MDTQHGATIIIVALMLVVLLGFAALAVDIGYVMASRNEAQNVADAAALAGAGELGDQLWKTGDWDQTAIEAAAHDVALKNNVAGESFNLPDDAIEICRWDWSSKSCGALDGGNPTAVRVMVRKENVGTFFARILNIDFFSVSAVATAALSGVSEMPDEVIPVGISSYWFEHVWEGEFCDQPIKFYPTNSIEGCAGWHVFTESQSTPSNLWSIMEEINDETYDYPETELGETEYNFTGGTVQSALCQNNKYSFEDLYADNKEWNDETGQYEWKTSVVVYGAEGCDNPTGDLPIIGYSTVIITGVTCSPDKTIDGIVICDEYKDSRGGGGEYGTLGRIPGLVE